MNARAPDASVARIGEPMLRVEDQRFLTGQGRYVDDIELAGMVHGAVLLSPYAHARVVSIDTGQARTAPGVVEPHMLACGRWALAGSYDHSFVHEQCQFSVDGCA